jgi:hypothetical protein
MLNCSSNATSTERLGTRRRIAPLTIGYAVIAALAAATVMSSAMAESTVTLYAFSRATVPGIPGGPGGGPGSGTFPPKYYLYIEVKPGSRVAVQWAFVRGQYYDCALKKVSTPVLVESDPGVPTDKKETLVPKTASDVYGVVLGDVKARAPSNDQEKELTANHEAVISLLVDKANAYVSTQSIKALRPAAAM